MEVPGNQLQTGSRAIGMPLEANGAAGNGKRTFARFEPGKRAVLGREKVLIHGVERELIRLDTKSDVGEWGLWLDDQLKLQRILDPASNTEVVRD